MIVANHSVAELSADEIRRYGRHLILPEVGTEGQLKLKNSRVLLIGAGGLGSPSALYLAAAGVGTLGIADFDRVDESNLQRQLLYGSSDVGRPKVEAARERLAEINSFVKVETHQLKVDASNALELFDDYDVIADGSDNFPTRYLVNDACVLAGKPNVYGSIFRFEGQVSVFATEQGPCYRCLFPEPPPAGSVPSCAEAGVLGVLPGIIGSLQTNEVLKLLLGQGDPLVGRLLLFDALKGNFRELSLPKDPECPVCGPRATRTSLEQYEEVCDVDGVEPPAAGDTPFDPNAFNVTCQELADWRDELVVLDVRSPMELQICRLPSAEWIPLPELPARWQELEPGRPTVVHCHHGPRAVQAVQFLRTQGFDKVWNLTGGIDAWSREIDPSVPRY